MKQKQALFSYWLIISIFVSIRSQASVSAATPDVIKWLLQRYLNDQINKREQTLKGTLSGAVCHAERYGTVRQVVRYDTLSGTVRYVMRYAF